MFFSTFPVRAECLQPKLPDISFGCLFNNIGTSYAQASIILKKLRINFQGQVKTNNF